jgi:hypothetical protein
MRFLIIVATAAIVLFVGVYLYNYLKRYGVRDLSLDQLYIRAVDRLLRKLKAPRELRRSCHPDCFTENTYPKVTLVTERFVYDEGICWERELKQRMRGKKFIHPFLLEVRTSHLPWRWLYLACRSVCLKNGWWCKEGDQPFLLHFKEGDLTICYHLDAMSNSEDWRQELVKFVSLHERRITKYVEELGDHLVNELYAIPLEEGEGGVERLIRFRRNFWDYIQNVGHKPTVQDVLSYGVAQTKKFDSEMATLSCDMHGV